MAAANTPLLDQLVPPLYPQEQAAAPTTVLVTGACGYIAANTIKRLLAAGHTVHGTVRDLHGKHVAELEALPGAKQRLKLFKADLLKPEGWKEAMEGCTAVLHIASPYILDPGTYGKKAQERLVDPAVRGTDHVLRAAMETPTVKRVVQTSSVAACAHSYSDKPKGCMFDEKDHNSKSSLDNLPYHYSKVLAERKAWELASQQTNWDLVVINPCMVWGPPALPRGDGESMNFFRKLWASEFSPACPLIGSSHVDVRDVAAMLCVAAFDPKANGRYLASGDCKTFADLTAILAELYPKELSKPWIHVPRWLAVLLAPTLGVGRDVMRAVAGGCTYASGEKSKAELGVTYIPIKQTLKDMAEALEQYEIIKPIRR